MLFARRYAECRLEMSVVNKHWEHFAHEADMGVRGFGVTREEAYEQGALALTAVVTDPKTVTDNEVVDINCEAPDEEFPVCGGCIGLLQRHRRR